MSLNDAEQLTLSASDKSYKCVSQVSFTYNTQSADNVTYTITQTMSNLQVQAFGVSNDAFSDRKYYYRVGQKNIKKKLSIQNSW